MCKKIPSLLIACLLAASAQAAIEVDLLTDRPPSDPLVMVGGTVDGLMTVGVVKQSQTPEVNPGENAMTGWEIHLTIVPLAGSSGTLQFNDAMFPSDYIFGSPGLAFTTSISDSDLVVRALDGTFPGVAVPEAPGANLVAIDFAASPSARGLFGIVADALDIGGVPENTFWVNGRDPPVGPAPVAFRNVPVGAGAVEIGRVLVNPIPEPLSMFAWCVLGSIGFLGYCCRRKLVTRLRCVD